MAADRETRASTIGKWLLAIVVPASALAIGTLHTPTLIIMTLTAAISCALLWLEAPRRTSQASRWVLLAMTILVGVTLVQSLPLPAGVASFVAPANADVWARALMPFDETGPSWHPITVAPPATHVELLKGALYACVFIAALRISSLDGGSTFLEWVIVASTSVLAIVSLAHAAVHATRVFGLYRPHEEYGFAAGRLGPLLNSNHLASYLNVGAFVAAGVAVADRRAIPRGLAVGAALLLAGTSVWASSRGGMGSLLFGVCLFGGLALFRRGGSARAEIVIALVVFIGAGVLLGLGSSDMAREELGNHDVSKLAVAGNAADLIRLAPVFGVGRGAFETIFPFVRQGNEYVTFLAVENVAVQWLVEWGVPVALAAAAAFAVALRPSIVLTSTRPAIGAWVAILAVVLHDLVDFHLEVPAVVELVVVCIAVVVGGRAISSERRARRPPRVPTRFAAFAASAFALAAIALVLPNVAHSVREDRDAIAQVAIDPHVDRETFRRELRSAMERYPAEPFFPLAGAIRAQGMREDGVVPWVARALERYPGFGRAHLVLARSLAAKRSQRAQARLEYRLALLSDRRLEEAVAREAPSLVYDKDSALELVPPAAIGVPMLERLAAALVNRLPSTAAELDEDLAQREPSAAGPRRRRIQAVLSDLENDHPWCAERAACAAPGIQAARELVARGGDKCASHILLARLRVAIGEATEALDELSRATETTVDRTECLRAIVQLSTENGDRRRADQALDRALRGGCGGRDECLQLYSWAASTEEARGNPVKAIAFYKRASEIAPEIDEYLVRAGDLAVAAGLSSEAVDAYGKLAARHPENPEYARRADEQRAKGAERRFAVPSAP